MVPEKSSGNPDSLAEEMRRAIVALAGPRSWLDTRESMIARAARKAGLTFRQARALFYGETADPKYSVVRRVREAVDLEAARREHQKFMAGIRALEAALSVQDENFYRPHIDALHAATGRVDRAMDGGES